MSSAIHYTTGGGPTAAIAVHDDDYDDWWFTATFVHVVDYTGSEQDETPFRYAHAEIRTRVVVICGPTRYR